MPPNTTRAPPMLVPDDNGWFLAPTPAPEWQIVTATSACDSGAVRAHRNLFFTRDEARHALHALGATCVHDAFDLWQLGPQTMAVRPIANVLFT